MKWQEFKTQFLQLDWRDPEKTATGLALGVFWGFVPVFGVQILGAVFCAHLFKVNKVAATVGTLLTNPLTTIPFLTLSFFVGQVLTGKSFEEAKQLAVGLTQGKDWLQHLGSAYEVLFLGSITVGAVLGTIVYLIGKWIALRRKSR